MERFLETIEQTGYGRPGFADTYDRYRPAPPSVLADVLTLAARTERPRLVVDLGCGTGLSTRLWAGRADEVVGIDANPGMLARARAATRAADGVRYAHAAAEATGLPDGAADIVTCSQSFHWMPVDATLAEAARLLRRGGVFAAYDYGWPPVVGPEAERAFEAVLEATRDVVDLGHQQSEKAGHAERLRASGRFRYVHELALHALDEGDAERFVGLVGTIGPLVRALADARAAPAVGQLDRLRDVAERTISAEARRWFWRYEVRVGVV